MKVLCDINTSFQNSLIGLATIIYQSLDDEMSFDEICANCKTIYSNNELKTQLNNEDIYEAILLLYCKDKINYINGKVKKIK
jgi:hypothetical protein